MARLEYEFYRKIERMSKMENKKVIDVDENEDTNKPTLEKGNYLVEVIENGQLIKRIAVINAEINITRLAEGGMAIDLK